MKHLKLLASLFFLFVFLNAQAANDKKPACLNLLGAAIYNGILEEGCGFNGGVKEKLKAMYTQSGCRSIVPQEEVNKTAGDVLTDAKQRVQAMGKQKFCKGNKKAYFDLVTSTEKAPKFKKGESYSRIRQKMIKSGWSPYHSPNADSCGDDSRCKGRPEMEACAGTGMANCRFLWRKNEKTIGICTIGEETSFSSFCSD